VTEQHRRKAGGAQRAGGADAGAVATIASGEYLESWVYLMLDFAEAAFGLAIGYVVAARMLTPRFIGRPVQRISDRN